MAGPPFIKNPLQQPTDMLARQPGRQQLRDAAVSMRTLKDLAKSSGLDFDNIFRALVLGAARVNRLEWDQLLRDGACVAFGSKALAVAAQFSQIILNNPTASGVRLLVK